MTHASRGSTEPGAWTIALKSGGWVLATDKDQAPLAFNTEARVFFEDHLRPLGWNSCLVLSQTEAQMRGYRTSTRAEPTRRHLPLFDGTGREWNEEPRSP